MNHVLSRNLKGKYESFPISWDFVEKWILTEPYVSTPVARVCIRIKTDFLGQKPLKINSEAAFAPNMRAQRGPLRLTNGQSRRKG